MTMNDELLESLLREADPAKGLSVSPPRDLADQVRGRHARIQRRWTVVRNVAGAAACYTVGMLTMWLWTHSPAPDSVTARDQETSVSEPALPDFTQQVSDEPHSGRSAEQPHVVTLAGPAGSRYEALRNLGDRYLLQQGKVDLAVDVYSRALAEATQAESAISYEHDSWLLISLKRDRLVSAL